MAAHGGDEPEEEFHALGARLADARAVVFYFRDAVANNSAHERAALDQVVLVPFAAALWHRHLRHASAVTATRDGRKSEWLYLCRPPARPAAGEGGAEAVKGERRRGQPVAPCQQSALGCVLRTGPSQGT